VPILITFVVVTVVIAWTLTNFFYYVKAQNMTMLAGQLDYACAA
jgi:hypothetical protein